jgi:hypothetical protein
MEILVGNGAEWLGVKANGPFAFRFKQPNGRYDVKLLHVVVHGKEVDKSICHVQYGSGHFGSQNKTVSNVRVVCAANLAAAFTATASTKAAAKLSAQYVQQPFGVTVPKLKRHGGRSCQDSPVLARMSAGMTPADQAQEREDTQLPCTRKYSIDPSSMLPAKNLYEPGRFRQTPRPCSGLVHIVLDCQFTPRPPNAPHPPHPTHHTPPGTSQRFAARKQ